MSTFCPRSSFPQRVVWCKRHGFHFYITPTEQFTGRSMYCQLIFQRLGFSGLQVARRMSFGLDRNWKKVIPTNCLNPAQSAPTPTLAEDNVDVMNPANILVEKIPSKPTKLKLVRNNRRGFREEASLIQKKENEVEPPKLAEVKAPVQKKKTVKVSIKKKKTPSVETDSSPVLPAASSTPQEVCSECSTLCRISVQETEDKTESGEEQTLELEDVLVVKTKEEAEKAMERIEEIYSKDQATIFACDTEVRDIDILNESPCGHGEVTCFSVYCGESNDFGSGDSPGSPLTHLWVDTMLENDEKETKKKAAEIIDVFRKFFEDEKYLKVWHNYGFDRHVVKNTGIYCCGFGGDTMHMARLWDSSRKGKGYSLESLSTSSDLGLGNESKKTSMKAIFGRPKLRKDNTPGKVIEVPKIEELQREEKYRNKWIHYSTRDAKATYDLYQQLKKELKSEEKNACVMDKAMQECYPEVKTLWDFYTVVWKPFGELLTDMESRGFLVDTEYLREAQKKAEEDKLTAATCFREWVETKIPNAKYMNITSDLQIRTLLFAGLEKKNKNKDKNEKKLVDLERIIKVRAPEEEEPEEDEEETEKKKKRKSKWKEVKLHGLWGEGKKSVLKPEIFTAAGWPAVSAVGLKALIGKTGVAQKLLKELGAKSKVSDLADFEDVLEDAPLESTKNEQTLHNLTRGSEIGLGQLYASFKDHESGLRACEAVESLIEVGAIDTLLSSFILPLQEDKIKTKEDGRIHGSMNINTETGRLSCRRPNLQNQPALEKDRYKIRSAFKADTAAGKTLIVADYGQLELRILAHIANCKSMIKAFKVGGDFHSRTAVGMYDYIQKAIDDGKVVLEEGTSHEDGEKIPLVKDVYGIERRKAKVLNFSIAYGKTAHGLSKDWKVDIEEAKETLARWYADRKEVKAWQENIIREGKKNLYVTTLLGRRRHLPDLKSDSPVSSSHAQRAAINTPIQGSAADIATAAMIRIKNNEELQELDWHLLSQVHDEVILEGPKISSERALEIVVECMKNPFPSPDGGGYTNPLRVELSVDAKSADNWYDAK